MEQKKFRLKLNLFDGIVLLLAVAVAAFLLWRTMKPAVAIQSDPSVISTVRYTIRFQRWAPGVADLVEAGDQLADNVKNYEVGHVVSAQTVPARMQVLDLESRRYVWTEVDGFEDVLVTVEAPCSVNSEAITVGGGYEVRVGEMGYFRGEGYMGSGRIVAIEEVRG